MVHTCGCENAAWVCVLNSEEEEEEEEVFGERNKKNDWECTVNTHKVLMYCRAATHARAYVLQTEARHEASAEQTSH